jgi:hypothetical protein
MTIYSLTLRDSVMTIEMLFPQGIRDDYYSGPGISHRLRQRQKARAHRRDILKITQETGCLFSFRKEANCCKFK